MPDKFVQAATSAEVWELLETEAGLQADDYDAHVVAELRDRLGLSPDGTVAGELRANQISVERFVEAFFASVTPYVTMWGDLLALFERAAATSGGSNLQVAYRFDEAGTLELDFDLDHFRRVVEIVEQVITPFDLSGPNVSGELWALSSAVNVGPWGGPTGDPEIDRFIETCRDADAAWPASMPPVPPTDDRRLDGLITEAWMLATQFLVGLQSLSRDHASLMSEVHYDDPRHAVAGASAGTVRQVESDFWLPTTVAALATAGAASEASPELPDDLDAALEPLRNADPLLSEPRRRLSEFLQLPIWMHRYELYSNWVCTQIVDALNDHGVRVHADRGAITFAFSGTHLATFDAFMPRLHMWTELRVPLEDPVGEGRTSAIQPDITLIADPITARRSPLAVECKQYKKASSKNFADAVSDYARGHPEARIVLVNYGPARAATILKRVADEVVDRAAVVGDLRPGESAQLGAFRREVRGALGLASWEVQPATAPGTDRIVLVWDAAPRDLDLHVTISGAREFHVYHGDLGAMDVEPFCALERDVTNGCGPEVIGVTRWLPARYHVVVDNYSHEGSLGVSGAVVTITCQGTEVEFRCPTDITSREWAVCSIDGASGNVIQPDPRLR